MSRSVAILGTGPSGLYLASLLAQKGFEVRVFDPKTPWETPAGWGVSIGQVRPLHLFQGGGFCKGRGPLDPSNGRVRF